MLRGLEGPIPAISPGILWPHFGRQRVKGLRTARGFLHPIRREDAVSSLAQSGDDLGIRTVNYVRGKGAPALIDSTLVA